MLLLPIYHVATMVSVIEWDDIHILSISIPCLFLYRCRNLEVEGIVIVILRWVTERMLHGIELARHDNRTIYQCHLRGIVLGWFLS